MRKKVRSKEFRLVKQGLHKLEAEEAKADSRLPVGETTSSSSAGAPLRSPLGNSFFGDPFLLILPNLLPFNTPVPFL